MNPEELERELRGALSREEAPVDFAARVMARVPRKRPRLHWAIAAGVVFGALVPTAIYEQRRERQVRAEYARQQLIAALQITATKIRQTRESIQRRANRI